MEKLPYLDSADSYPAYLVSDLEAETLVTAIGFYLDHIVDVSELTSPEKEFKDQDGYLIAAEIREDLRRGGRVLRGEVEFFLASISLKKFIRLFDIGAYNHNLDFLAQNLDITTDEFVNYAILASKMCQQNPLDSEVSV